MERNELFTVAIVALLIFLSVLLYVLVTSGNDAITDRWSISTNASAYDGIQNLRNVHIGDDGTVYLVDGRHVNAIDKNGVLKWTVGMPKFDNTSDNRSLQVMSTSASADGTIYAYLIDDRWSVDGTRGELVAVSPDGKLSWYKQYDASRFITFAISNDTLYLLRSTPTAYIFNLTALDRDGNILWVKDSVFGGPAFDDKGNAYLIHGHKIPIYSDELQSYYPNGTMRWSCSLSAQGIHAQESLQVRNGSLYIKSYYGIACTDMNGTLKWNNVFTPTRSHSSYFDEVDNIYWIDLSNVKVINPAGAVIAEYDLNRSIYSRYCGINNGILYTSTFESQRQNVSIESLPGVTITALSLKDNNAIWSYHIRPEPVRTVTIEPDNAYALIERYWEVQESNSLNATELYEHTGVLPGTTELRNNTRVSIYPGEDRIYISCWVTNYELPAVYGKAKCAYAGGLYVLDYDGKLLWQKPMDSYIDNLVEKNGTIYYSTGDGKFSATATGLTAGLLAAAAYMFLRFFMVGAVSRARSRLEKNENRNSILTFISDHPGCTLFDVARGLAMNVGTVRYHLLILTVNHRVKADRGDARYARYYSGSLQYTAEERLIISLLRRSQVEKLLNTLITAPGLPNTEISKETGMPESAVSRYLRELADQGVVVKRRSDCGKLTYVVDEKYLQVITSHLR